MKADNAGTNPQRNCVTLPEKKDEEGSCRGKKKNQKINQRKRRMRSADGEAKA